MEIGSFRIEFMITWKGDIVISIYYKKRSGSVFHVLYTYTVAMEDKYPHTYFVNFTSLATKISGGCHRLGGRVSRTQTFKLKLVSSNTVTSYIKCRCSINPIVFLE